MNPNLETSLDQNPEENVHLALTLEKILARNQAEIYS